MLLEKMEIKLSRRAINISMMFFNANAGFSTCFLKIMLPSVDVYYDMHVDQNGRAINILHGSLKVGVLLETHIQSQNIQ